MRRGGRRGWSYGGGRRQQLRRQGQWRQHHPGARAHSARRGQAPLPPTTTCHRPYRPPVVCVPQEQLQALMQDEDKLHAFLQENPQMMSEVMKLVG